MPDVLEAPQEGLQWCLKQRLEESTHFNTIFQSGNERKQRNNENILKPSWAYRERWCTWNRGVHEIFTSYHLLLNCFFGCLACRSASCCFGILHPFQLKAPSRAPRGWLRELLPSGLAATMWTSSLSFRRAATLTWIQRLGGRRSYPWDEQFMQGFEVFLCRWWKWKVSNQWSTASLTNARLSSCAEVLIPPSPRPLDLAGDWKGLRVEDGVWPQNGFEGFLGGGIGSVGGSKGDLEHVRLPDLLGGHLAVVLTRTPPNHLNVLTIASQDH